MKSTWSMQVVEEEPREFRERLFAQIARGRRDRCGASGRSRRGGPCRPATLRARPRAIDQTAPVSSASSSIACDISRATRPLPSRNG